MTEPLRLTIDTPLKLMIDSRRMVLPLELAPEALVAQLHLPAGSEVWTRLGGPTRKWRAVAAATADQVAWVEERPGMILFEDLTTDYIELEAARLDAPRATGRLVDGVPPLRLLYGGGAAFLAVLERHRYDVEDAIGCDVDVEQLPIDESSEKRLLSCALAIVPVTTLKSWVAADDVEPGLRRCVNGWCEQAVDRGADSANLVISRQRPDDRGPAYDIAWQPNDQSSGSCAGAPVAGNRPGDGEPVKRFRLSSLCPGLVLHLAFERLAACAALTGTPIPPRGRT